jgi:hypothetical protein
VEAEGTLDELVPAAEEVAVAEGHDAAEEDIHELGGVESREAAALQAVLLPKANAPQVEKGDAQDGVQNEKPELEGNAAGEPNKTGAAENGGGV